MIKLIVYSAIMAHIIILSSFVVAMVCFALKQYILGAVFAGYVFREFMNVSLCSKEVDEDTAEALR